MFFPVVMFCYDSWTIKNAEHQRIDAFKLWHRRLLRVPWTASRSNQSLLKEVKWSEVNQSCPTLCDPMDCSLPGSSVHGILQARILERVAISFSRSSSRSRDRTWVSHIAGRSFNLWATREAQSAPIFTGKTDVESEALATCKMWDFTYGLDFP